MWTLLIYIFAGISYTAALHSICTIGECVNDLSETMNLEKIPRTVELTPFIALLVVLFWPVFSSSTLYLMYKERL